MMFAVPWMVIVAAGVGTSAQAGLSHWTTTPECWMTPTAMAVAPLTREQMLAVRDGRVAEAAIPGVPLVLSRTFPEGTPDSLGTLVEESDVVLVGKATECGSYLAADGFGSARSVLVVNVELLLKGADVRVAAIDMLGGRVDLGQQRIVELRSTRMRLPLQPAGTYLLFLRRPAGDWAELKSELGAAGRGVTELFELTRGGGGVFALLPDGTVEPAITSRIGVAGEYAGVEASVLIAMVRSLARR